MSVLTVSNLQQLLSDLPPDLEVCTGGAAVQVVLRYHDEGAPDYISLDDDPRDYIAHLDPGDVALLWRSEEGV